MPDTLKKRYDVIYADPCWRYQNIRTGGSHTSGASQQYATMSLDELCDMPVASLAAPNSVCFLWATTPLGTDPYEVLDAWGFCCQIGTKVLTADLRWVSAEKLSVGDKLISFDETPDGSFKHRYRRFRWGTVLSTGVEPHPCYEIVLADGTSLVCTGEHQWLMRTSRYGNEATLRWIKTNQLWDHLKHHSRTAPLEMPRFVPVAEEDRTFEGGFLSAAFDAEGSILRKKWNISFAQNENALLDRVEEILQGKGMVFGKYYCYATPRNICHVMFKGGREETLRFLMRFRPPRLIQNWLSHDISASTIYKSQSVPIVDVKKIGVREVVTLQTDVGTYIAEGFGAHNTFKTKWYWHKTGRKGIGYWTRNAVEEVLIGVRGKVTPWRSTLDNWIEAAEEVQPFQLAPEGHSIKPQRVRLQIEELTPEATRVELFAREKWWLGWDAYGLDIDPTHDFRDANFWRAVGNF